MPVSALLVPEFDVEMKKERTLIRPEGGNDTAAIAKERVASFSLESVDVAQVEDPAGSFPGGVEASNTGRVVGSGESAAVAEVSRRREADVR